MKRTFFPVLLTALMISATAMAGPWSMQDHGSDDAVQFAKSVLKDQFETSILSKYPGAEIEWGARGIPNAEGGGWVVYAEVKPKNEEPRYFYFEITMNNILANPQLREKYGL